MSLINYFRDVTRESYQLIDRLQLSSEPRPLTELLTDLADKLKGLKASTVSRFQSLDRPSPRTEINRQHLGVGLNTLGMLSDRLTILTLKEWCLRHKTKTDDAAAKQLYETQTLDVIHALSRAMPGTSSMNTKLTHHKVEAVATTWEEAYYSLLMTNILLWESQEVLYTKDISILSHEELKSYIQWFSKGNLQRNEFIQLCETLYWGK